MTLAVTYGIDHHQVRMYSPSFSGRCRVMFISDTHIGMDDSRGQAYRPYSKRMAEASRSSSRYESFVHTLKAAKEEQIDLLVLGGDILSFPSEASMEWVQEQLASADIPYLYIAGNHDWHYEGMEGTSQELRAVWTEKRLKTLYQGHSPLMAAEQVHGLNCVVIDNSTYEILPEQLSFLTSQIERGLPLLLCMHIPLYAPGRSVSFGCGHPDWGADSDRLYTIERRQRWPQDGHSDVTKEFHRLVFAAQNVVGVLAGHTHQWSVDFVQCTPQVVAPAGLQGGYLMVDVLPPDEERP